MEWLLLCAICLSAAWTLWWACRLIDALGAYKQAKAEHERAKERLRRYTLGGGSDGEVWLTRQALACGLHRFYSDRRH